ncbi:MAG: glycosyltransferase [bacterium]|nr:glycosyltransferase [bacterium]
MISVIITAYNAESFILESVESILRQTEPDLECIVVDDGSGDRTSAVLREMSDPRVRLISPGRVGRGRALNLGIEQSQGEFIAIQDADDLSHPRRLEIERTILEKESAFSGLGTGQILFRGAEAPAWDMTKDPAEGRELHDISSTLLYRNHLSHTSFMVRRSALESAGFYDAGRKDLFDWDLYLRLVMKGHKIGKLDFPLAAKRIHGGQFFEVRSRLAYVRHCYQLQRAARRKMGKAWFLDGLFVLIYFYRLLPRPVRLSVHS